MKGILKDTFILFVIPLVAGFCLGGVHDITLEPIAKAQQASATATYKEVYPDAANFQETDELIEQAVPGAVPHQQTMFPPGEPQLEVPFGVLPPDPQASA